MSLLELIGERETYGEFRKTFYDELHVRTKNGMKEKAKAGDFPGCAPLGYKNVWDGARKVIAVESEATLAERSLIVSVKNAAADLFAAQEAQSLGVVQVEVAQLFRDAAARRAQLGDVPPVQVQRAELELSRVENDLESARAELNSLIGQAPETPLRVALPISTGLADALRTPSGFFRSNPGNVPATGSTSSSGNIPATPRVEIAPSTSGQNAAPAEPQTPVLGASSQIGSDLVAQRSQVLPSALTRPDIVGAQATLEARRAQIRVLERGRLPQIELQARRNTVTGSGSTALRAVITVPIFDFGSNKHERRALEAEVRAQEAQIALLQNQAATQVEQALIRLGQQRATVERYRNGIVPLTLDLLRKTQIGYASGASTYLEVLEAQRTLRQVQTEYLQALVGTRISEAQLEGALGAAPPANINGTLSNPNAPVAPPGTSVPGIVPEGTIPPNTIAPLNPIGTPPTNTVPTIPATPDTSAIPQGGR